MRIKEGVNVAFLDSSILIALQVAERICQEFEFPELVVTSGYRPVPGNSLHAVGRAVDLRLPSYYGSEEGPQEKDLTFRQELHRRLGKDFDVVLETDHVHIEFDPR